MFSIYFNPAVCQKNESATAAMKDEDVDKEQKVDIDNNITLEHVV